MQYLLCYSARHENDYHSRQQREHRTPAVKATLNSMIPVEVNDKASWTQKDAQPQRLRENALYCRERR